MLQAGNVRPTEVTAYSKTAVSNDVPEAFFLERYRAAYALEIAHFFDAVQEGKPVRTTVADGLKALELADAATRSWRGRHDHQAGGGMKASVRIGIVGLGRGWVSPMHVTWRGTCQVRRSWPLAVRSQLNANGAGANLPELAFYSDYEAMLKDASLDAVWLVTPTSLHPD